MMGDKMDRSAEKGANELPGDWNSERFTVVDLGSSGNVPKWRL